jgi:hypothetical protein
MTSNTSSFDEISFVGAGRRPSMTPQKSST